MTVALDDLGRRRRRLEAEALAHQALDLGIGRRVRPDRAGELADTHSFERALQARSCAIELEGPNGELQPECRRLCVDSVRTSDRQRVAVLLGPRDNAGQRALETTETSSNGSCT